MKSTPISIQQYFAFVRPAADFDEGDGLELGRLLYYQLSKLRKNDDELREELNTFIERTTVLRECEYKYRFLDELLFQIIKNKTRLGAVQSSFTVKTVLASLTSNEAGRIGKSLAMMLMTNTTSGVAAEEYIFKYPALEELAAEYRWFKPMLGAIAEELMSNVLYEMSIAKAAEVATESVPGLVLQLVAVLISPAKDRSVLALVSVGISAASAGLAGTSMWYDTDTDPGQRQRNPRCFGMVPDQGRGKAFAVTFVMCSLQALARAGTIALLAVTNINWMAAFVAADLGLFFAYKLARRDFLT
ncbi:hypothetical protein TeGR_g7687 [Tetraparma gracilis]|uniref:Uncharacterized protein n=1 Tax=Tetraparma gracilis TaxID=2962635 RepID=A0ABQ6N646_9STRA|nr:hypothetical protein TeGR_g7687 [Tetraparma gracilis]